MRRRTDLGVSVKGTPIGPIEEGDEEAEAGPATPRRPEPGISFQNFSNGDVEGDYNTAPNFGGNATPSASN